MSCKSWNISQEGCQTFRGGFWNYFSMGKLSEFCYLVYILIEVVDLPVPLTVNVIQFLIESIFLQGWMLKYHMHFILKGSCILKNLIISWLIRYKLYCGYFIFDIYRVSSERPWTFMWVILCAY